MKYDILVIGSGPAGYVCAIKAAQLGFKVACVEKDDTLGGTCLNVGCIPSKALLKSSYLYDFTKNKLEKFGAKAEKVSFDLAKMMSRKDTVVATLNNGVAGLFKKNKIEKIKGKAEIISKNTVRVGDSEITADNIVIATGSDVMTIPNVKIDEERVVSSTGALSLKKVPEHLVVIGGGVIGLELGSIWRRLGAKVTVVEFMDSIIPTMDREIGKQFQKILENQGFEFKLSTKVSGVSGKMIGNKLKVETNNGNLEADTVLVSVGRKPYTEGLGLEKLGIKQDDKGRVKVDDNFKTNVGNIYAVGDVIEGPMLAHKGEEEGVAVAEIIAGQAGHVNYDVIPSVVYTSPEVASVGKTEEELKEEGINYKVGKFPFKANGKAIAEEKTDGFVKILADEKTDRVLGVHIIGDDAGIIIAEAVTAMEYYASAEDIARICHAHPTTSEAMKEAALGVGGMSLHV